MNQQVNSSSKEFDTNRVLKGQTPGVPFQPNPAIVISHEIDDHSVMSDLMYDQYELGGSEFLEAQTVWDYVVVKIVLYAREVAEDVRSYEGDGQIAVPIKLTLRDSVLWDEFTVSIFLTELAKNLDPDWDFRVLWKQKYHDPKFFLVKPLESEEDYSDTFYCYDTFRMTESIWL